MSTPRKSYFFENQYQALVILSKICFRISPGIEPSSLLADLGLGAPSVQPVSAQIAPISASGDLDEDMMPGTRRLDMDITEYEYVDTDPRWAI